MPGAVRGHVRRAPIRIRLRARGKARREAALPRRLRSNAGAVVMSAAVMRVGHRRQARLRLQRIRVAMREIALLAQVPRRSVAGDRAGDAARLRDMQAAVYVAVRCVTCGVAKLRLKCGVPPLRPTKCGRAAADVRSKMRRAATATCGAKCGADCDVRRSGTAGAPARLLCGAGNGRHSQRARQQCGRQASGNPQHGMSSTVLAPSRGRIVKLFKVSFVRRGWQELCACH